MMPENALSTTPVPAPFVGARARSISARVDFEDGGIAIQDPSQGNQYQVWRARLIGDDVILDAPTVPEFVLFSGEGITEISFTFDQNMRPALAFVQDGLAKLWWFDSVAGSQVITEYPDSITPRVVLDDKRSTQLQNSDIILAYVRSGTLYTRQQRDRFTIEYTHSSGVTPLIKIGFNRQLRLQFMHEVPE